MNTFVCINALFSVNEYTSPKMEDLNLPILVSSLENDN